MCKYNRTPFLKVRLHTTTISVVDNCSLFSLVTILKDKEGKGCIEDNHNHIYSYLPIYNIRCPLFVWLMWVTIWNYTLI